MTGIRSSTHVSMTTAFLPNDNINQLPERGKFVDEERSKCL